MIEPTNRTFGTTEPNFWLGNAIPTARILKIPGQFSTLQQNIPSIPIICPQTYPIILIDFSCQWRNFPQWHFLWESWQLHAAGPWMTSLGAHPSESVNGFEYTVTYNVTNTGYVAVSENGVDWPHKFNMLLWWLNLFSDAAMLMLCEISSKWGILDVGQWTSCFLTLKYTNRLSCACTSAMEILPRRITPINSIPSGHQTWLENPP